MSLVKDGNFPAPAAAPPARALSPKAQRLAELLLARSHNGQCVISRAELCRLTGWDHTTVTRYLKELKARGIIDWERRKRQPNCYRFVDGNFLRQDSPLHPELAALVRRGQNVLVCGPPGVGKSFQLSLLSDGIVPSRVVLQFPHGTVRESLLGVVDQLAQAGELAPEQLDSPPSRLTVKDLAALVQHTLARSEKTFLVIVDNLDTAPPSLRRTLLALLSLYNVQMVAAATDEKKVQDLVGHFVVFRLPPLSREQTERWVRAFLTARGIPVLGGEAGLRRLCALVHLRTNGNPRDIKALLRKIEAHGYVDRRLLREELHPRGRWQFADMTWLIVLTLALVMAVRYLGLGVHDRLLYVLAGFGYAFGLLLRWFSYRWRRK